LTSVAKLPATTCATKLEKEQILATMPSNKSLDELLSAARPFLRGEEQQADPALPQLAAVLRAAGAGEC
jgi:hypothetical protein